MSLRCMLRGIVSAASALAAGAALAQNPAARLEAPTVEVIGTTPLPVLGTPAEQVPANVQTATGDDFRRRQSTSLPELMHQQLTGVAVNELQNNPFQPDVSFRGFVASPLLGAPQGLSVFQDGARVNEAFGDVVNWDLIPQSAISSINLIPGTNPVFGLNTLGGALSIVTKSGFQYPGALLQAYGGSFARRAAEFEVGGHGETMDYFLTGNVFKENGWRDHSPSDVRQLFGKVGWETSRSDLDVSYTWAETDLTGNGLAPPTLLEHRREAVFTFPDNTRNRLNFINASGSHWLNDDVLLAGNVYYRRLKTRTLNGDLNDDYAEEFEDCGGDPTCEEDLLESETGENNRTFTSQRRYGLAAQLTHLGNIGARRNRFTIGFNYDDGRSNFEQTEQEAVLTAERGTVATDDEELDVSLRGTTRRYGIYVTDTLSLTDTVHLTISGRYDHTRVELDDRIGTDLDGRHRFERFNPAIGINLTPRSDLVYYAAYSEGSRAPSPIELGCADPANPCILPNAMAADPPLDQVVAKTWETGARGRFGSIGWSAALFRTTLHDDIHFIASSTTGAGYFDNVGRTRRQGLELGLNGRHGDFTWSAGYALVDATFESPITIVAPDNSTADASGFITVEPGDRIPLIPKHTLKLTGEYAVTPAWSIGATVIAASEQYARGNENNDHQPDGVQFLHSGKVSGYAILNLHTRYRIAGGLELFARVYNVFDKEYATAGALAINPFDATGQFQPDPDDWRSETFLAPGAPLGAWIGVRYALGERRTMRTPDADFD